MAMPARKKYAKRKSRSSGKKNIGKMVSMMKTVALKVAETKKSSNYSTDTIKLFHNLAHYQGNLLATSQGVTDPEGLSNNTLNRIGDEVIARGIKMKFFTQTAADRPNVMFRIIVYWYNTIVGSPSATPLDDSYFWAGTNGSGGNMNRMLDKANTDRIRVIFDKIYNPSLVNLTQDPQNHSKTRFHEFWVPFNNRKIKYNADDSNYPKFKDVGFLVLAYDATTTAQTDGLGGYQFAYTFYYKDP